jgi:hypothetical protein
MAENNMMQIKEFFNSSEKPITMAEFKEFWNSLSEEEKAELHVAELN